MHSTEKIKLLLENIPEAKESYHNIIAEYRFHFSHDEVYISDSFIEREVRMLKRKYPNLRDANWESRQKHSVKMREKFRSQEKPENLQKSYSKSEDVSHLFHKETIFQAIKRFFSFN